MGTRGRLLAPEPKWISRSSQMDFSGVRLWFPRLNFPGARFLALRQDGAFSDLQLAEEGWFPLSENNTNLNSWNPRIYNAWPSLTVNIYLVLNNILSGDPLTCPFLVCPSIWYVGCIKCTTLHLSWWCHWRILGLICIYLVWCTIQQLVQLHIWEARLDRCKYPMYYGGWVSPALPECPTGGCPSIEQYVTHPSPSYAQSCNHVHYHVPRSTYHVSRSIRHICGTSITPCHTIPLAAVVGASRSNRHYNTS